MRAGRHGRIGKPRPNARKKRRARPVTPPVYLGPVSIPGAIVEHVYSFPTALVGGKAAFVHFDETDRLSPVVIERPRCVGCGEEIDPTTCHCGIETDYPGHDNHYPVPMGCNCHRRELDEIAAGFGGGQGARR